MRKLLMTASTQSHICHFHLPYLQWFQTHGWQVHVACGAVFQACPFCDRLISLPLVKNMWSPQNFLATHQLRRLIRQEQYDLVITHTALASFFTRLAVWGLRKRPKVVNVVHGYLFDQNTAVHKRWLLTAAERMTVRQTDLLLTMNRWDHAFALRNHLCSSIQNIPGIGVDLDRFSTEHSAAALRLRDSHRIPKGALLLLYAAEFSPRKSQNTLIRAMEMLPAQVHLVLAGSGGMLEEMKQLAEQLGVSERVHFLGYVNQMADWYCAADVVVSASRSEGLPFNIMEAMAMKRPIVATAVKGHEDLLVHGETGLLFPFGDAAACASGIMYLMDHPDKARSMGAAAGEAVRQYDLRLVLPQVTAAYLQVLEEI